MQSSHASLSLKVRGELHIAVRKNFRDRVMNPVSVSMERSSVKVCCLLLDERVHLFAGVLYAQTESLLDEVPFLGVVIPQVRLEELCRCLFHVLFV